MTLTDRDQNPPRSPRHGSRMQAHARLTTTLETLGVGRPPITRVTGLRSEPPLVLRPTIGKGREPWVRGDRTAARVSLTAGAAGPIGGDQLTLTIRVGAGSTLVLSEISHTLLLPSHDHATSTTTTHVIVEPGATLVWLPEPIIAARGSRHVGATHITLGDESRLLVREELLLGRHGEPSGRLLQRLRVTSEGRPLYHQDLQVGDDTSQTPAVTSHYRAVGSVLVVDPDWTPADQPAPQQLSATAALMPLAPAAVLITAVADDSLQLRTALDLGIAALGPTWDPDP